MVLEKTLESSLDCKEIQPDHPKEISPEYSLEGLMLKLELEYFCNWCKELTHLKRPWCWERLKAGGERDDRGWDGWMTSPTQWTWVWVSSGSSWWTGRPGVLQSIGSQRVGQIEWMNWTKFNWTEAINKLSDLNKALPMIEKMSKVKTQKGVLEKSRLVSLLTY